MEQNVSEEELRIEILREDHTLSGFQSRTQELVDFLVDDALQNQMQKISLTFLFFYKEQLVGYITLLNDSIKLRGELREFFKNKDIHYGSLPALKVGRICVDSRFERRGIGTEMIRLAYRHAEKIQKELAGCRFVTLDAKRSSLAFYEKLGFKVLKPESKGLFPLYLDL